MKHINVAYSVTNEAGRECQRHRVSTDPQIMAVWLDKLPATHTFLAVEKSPADAIGQLATCRCSG